jgi:Rhodopirellula transposase DDE domain
VKVIAIGKSHPEDRNAQFENIAKLRLLYESAGWPVLSVDTKKKEFLGALYRDGKLYSEHGQALKRFDHDFPYLAEGKVVPHGIYDLQNNSGFLTIGTSAETPAFIAASLGLWWNYRGRFDYGGRNQVLLLMDSGGANACRSIEFKHEMLKLATRTGLTIRIAHYPPYCSKWNPIEHRLFPHVTRSLQGIYLDSAETVKCCINERATTKTGLETRAYVLDKVFERGVKEEAPLPSSFPLIRSPELPEWNYICYPSAYYNYLN